MELKPKKEDSIDPVERPIHIRHILVKLLERIILNRELRQDMSDTCGSYTGQREATQQAGVTPDNGDNL